MKQIQTYRIDFQHFQEDGAERWIPGIVTTDLTEALTKLNQARIDSPKKTYRLQSVLITEETMET